MFIHCEEGKFHQNSEFCRVDFQTLKSEHGGPFVGRILVTTFNNPWYYKVDLKKARDIIKSADIVFISGGDVDRGMRVLREKSIIDFLVELFQLGKLFFGSSVGAIMLAKEWVR